MEEVGKKILKKMSETYHMSLIRENVRFYRKLVPCCDFASLRSRDCQRRHK
jgi:hypothetical protein